MTNRGDRAAHDIHHWVPVPLEVGIYACSDCGIRGRRILASGKGKPGRIKAYKQQIKRRPTPNVLTEIDRKLLERFRDDDGT